MSDPDSAEPDTTGKAAGIGPEPFPVVGIGASAGGLDAITRLLKSLQPDPGMAFLVVQHLDPNRVSLLREILSKATPMRVLEATEGMVVERNRVYVIPPASNMALADGAPALRPRDETSGVPMPIDYLFRSMAEQRGRRSVGVILSGGGTDGSLGIAAIKGEGGITFAQDEYTAQHDSMPRSAIASGCVDFILEPEGIAGELMRIGSHAYVNGDQDPKIDAIPTETDSLEAVFSQLRSSRGLDFSHYKRKTIVRRIERRMALRRVDDLADYHQILRDDPAELAALYQDLLIRVTSFFRDPRTFDFLQQTVFPGLIQGRPTDRPIRIWVPGCSTGEEVYSLAIALIETMGDKAGTIPIKILASDINESALERARSGLYIENVAMDLSPERLRRFFARVNNHYQVGKTVRDLCIFSKHDLTRDPPFADLDLVSCRNVMIYFDLGLQRRVVPLFHYALRPGGHLVLGSAETIGSFGDLFTLVDREGKVYERMVTPTRLILDFPPRGRDPGRDPKTNVPAGEGRGLSDLHREADRAMLSRYAPPGVLIDENMTILEYRGQTGAYLEPSPGTASLDLTRMVRGGLSSDLRAAVAQAKIERAPVRRENLHIREGDGFRRVNVEIIPLRNWPESLGYFLVVFEEPAAARAVAAESPSQPALATPPPPPQELQYREELDAAQRFIQSLLDEHEVTRQNLTSANEEVLASNEELQSINEELQSTNEELQTTKEEMLSANEELVTVNDELRFRITELGRLNDDLSNLIQGLSLPIVMVDRDLRIRRFTPPSERVLNLIGADVGRPLGDIRPNIDVPDLAAIVAETVDSLKPLEQEVHDRDGHWYSLRIRPYLTSDNRVEGATLALVDIDALKQSYIQLKDARDYADAIVQTVWEPLVVLDGDLCIRRGNQAFYQTFGLSALESEGHSLIQLLGDRWIRPDLSSQLVNVLSNNVRLENIQIDIEPRGSAPRTFLLNAHRIYWEGLRTQRILLAMEDITDREREAEKSRLLASEKAARAEAEQANRNKDAFLAMLAHELRNPLAPLLNCLLILRSPRIDSADIEWAVAIMERQVRHMSRLIEDLLDASRITTGKIQLRKETIQLGSILAHAVEIAGPAIQARRHELTVKQPDDPVRLVADPARLEQVMANLLSNAAKYTPDSGQISLEAEALDDLVVFRVRDNGNGIAPELLPTIFDLFSQGNQSLDRPEGGLGIGLTLVRTLVELHGGTVEVRSEGPGRGSEFTVRLPRQFPPESAISASDPPGTRDGPSRRVLVVDDNKDAAATLARLLSGSGHHVEIAYDGLTALALARESCPEVILLDLGLPGMDGYEVARRIRGDAASRRPLLVAVTGYGQEPDRQKTREAGFDHHLVKPVDILALQTVIARGRDQRRGLDGSTT